MLKLTLFELSLRGIPEAFLFVLGVYAFSKNYLDKKRWVLSSLLYAAVVYFIRSLPIHYGVHIILNIFAIIIITININKIDLNNAIQMNIITFILQLVCEVINIVIIKNIFKVDTHYVFNNPVLKTLYGIPSILIFGIIIIAYYLRLSKRKELSHITYGKSIK